MSAAYDGFYVQLPDDEPLRDMLGLVRAILWDDHEGQAAILANADLQHLALVTAATLAAALCDRTSDSDELDMAALTDDERNAAMAIIIAGCTGPDDPRT